MTALPSRFYRDPLEILIAEEEATCRGCAHRIIVFGREGCNKGKKPRRCKFYQEKEGTR